MKELPLHILKLSFIQHVDEVHLKRSLTSALTNFSTHTHKKKKNSLKIIRQFSKVFVFEVTCKFNSRKDTNEGRKEM